MNKKVIIVFCTIIFLLGLITGCSSDGEKLKSDLQQAISKQSELKNYSFTGSVDLQMDVSLSSNEQNPLTTSLLSMLTNSQISWQGISDIESSQLEIDVDITPHHSSTSISMPAIIKDNKLYFNIPLLNIDSEEYLFIDLGDQIEQQSSLFSLVVNHIVEGIDAKWYKEINNDNGNKTIGIEITEENYLDILQSLGSKYSLILDDLENSGLLSKELVDQLRDKNTDELKEAIKNLKIDKPGLISFSIDKNGYISEQSVNLYYSNQSIEFSHQLENINQTPEFTKAIPEKTRSFNEIIEQLSGATE